MDKNETASIVHVINSENHREVTINLNSISVSLTSSNEHEDMDFLVKKALEVLKDTKNW